MSGITAYSIALKARDYPTKYAGLLTFLDPYIDELIAARQGQANLDDNLDRYVLRAGTLAANLDFGGFRAVNGGVPVNPGDYTTKAFVESLAFGSALPNIAGSDGKSLFVRGGVADWGWRDEWVTVSASGAVAAGSSSAVNTAVAGITLALPTSPTADMWLNFKDAAMNAAVNPFYLDPGATHAFEDLPNGELVSCDYNGVDASIVYINGKWRFLNG